MFLFFDTETTGKFDFRSPATASHQPYICQLGGILTDAKGNTMGEMNVLIKPNGWTIPDEAAAVHGITMEDCENYGININDAIKLFEDFTSKAERLVAHNTKFDLGMLSREIHANNFNDFLKGKPWECTMDMNTNILKLDGHYGYKWPKLQECYVHYMGEEFEGAHDAMADVRACRDVYFKTKQYLKTERKG